MNPSFPPFRNNGCDVGSLLDETKMMEMRWHEARGLAQEQHSTYQEMTQRADKAKKEWDEKQKQYQIALQLQRQREKQWDKAMKTATSDLDAIRQEYREMTVRAEQVAKKLNAAEECVTRLQECNPRELKPCRQSPRRVFDGPFSRPPPHPPSNPYQSA